MTSGNTGAIVLARMLYAAGVTHIYGIPGGAISSFAKAVSEFHELAHILAKHEEGAAFMAQGHAHVTGGLGVVYTTTGPGATNALTGIANAYADHTPVLILTGNTPTTDAGRGAHQDGSGGNWSVDLVDAYRSVTKLSISLPSPSQLPRLVSYAIRTALSGTPGPVHVSIPADILEAEVSDVEERRWTDAMATTPSHPISPNPSSISDLSLILRSAHHPIILSGLGARTARAQDELVRLAELLQAPVATTLNGKSSFPEDHPLSLGVFGRGGNPMARAALLSPETDVIIAVGCALGEKSTLNWGADFLESATLCQIVDDPVTIGRGHPVALAVVGDARAVLKDVCSELATNEVPQPQRREMPFRGWSDISASSLQDGHGELRPSATIARLSEKAPEDVILFGDSGNSASWIGEYFVTRAKAQVFMSINFASMGYSYGAAIGGALAAPGTRVIAVSGDGSFAMNGMEVHTSVEENLPILWIILNNGEHAGLQRYSIPVVTKFRYQLDISTLARGMNCPSRRVSSLEELDAAIDFALEREGPYLIDARVAPES